MYAIREGGYRGDDQKDRRIADQFFEIVEDHAQNNLNRVTERAALKRYG